MVLPELISELQMEGPMKRKGRFSVTLSLRVSSKLRHVELDGDVLFIYKSADDRDNGPPLDVFKVTSVFEWVVDKIVLKKKKETFVFGLRVEVEKENDAATTDTLYLAVNSSEAKHLWFRLLRAATDSESPEALYLLQQKRMREDESRVAARKAAVARDKANSDPPPSSQDEEPKKKKKKKREEWTEHTAPDGRIYFYNRSSNKSRWDRPTLVVNEESEWTEHVAPDGRTYYYNKNTKKSRWDNPKEKPIKTDEQLVKSQETLQKKKRSVVLAEMLSASKNDDDQEAITESSIDRLKRLRKERKNEAVTPDEFLQEVAEDERGRKEEKNAEKKKRKKKDVADESITAIVEEKSTEAIWSKHTAKDGRTYYYNHETKKSKWKKPKELRDKPPSTADVAPVSTTTTNSTSLVVHDPESMFHHFSLKECVPNLSSSSAAVLKCSVCNTSPSTQRCAECQRTYCSSCAVSTHASSLQNHTLALMSVPFCQACESASATQNCIECAKRFCDECCSFLHRKAPRHLHTRTPLFVKHPHTPIISSQEESNIIIQLQRALADIKRLYKTKGITNDDRLFMKDILLHEDIVSPELSDALSQSDLRAIRHWIDLRRTNDMSAGKVEESIVVVAYSEDLSTCLRCFGTGKHLVVSQGLCAHCLRQQQQQHYQKALINDLPECRNCRGFGVALVTPNGLCLHCNRVTMMVRTTVPLSLCTRCNAVGKDLVPAGQTLCAHCQRQSNNTIVTIPPPSSQPPTAVVPALAVPPLVSSVAWDDDDSEEDWDDD